MIFGMISGWRSELFHRLWPSNVRRLLSWIASIFIIVLTACGQASSVRENRIVIPPTPTRSSTPTATSTRLQEQSTPMPTATLPATEVMTPTTESCPYSYFFEPAPGGCPLEEPTISAAAEQPFDNGLMIWLEATDSVYVFYGDQRWQRFDDDWSEDQPESDPAIVPPDGLFQPIRGFGKVWRENPSVRQELGWALGPELSFESKIQRQEAEEVGTEVIFLLTFNGQVFGLVSRDQNGGDWVIAAS